MNHPRLAAGLIRSPFVAPEKVRLRIGNLAKAVLVIKRTINFWSERGLAEPHASWP